MCQNSKQSVRTSKRETGTHPNQKKYKERCVKQNLLKKKKKKIGDVFLFIWFLGSIPTVFSCPVRRGSAGGSRAHFSTSIQETSLSVFIMIKKNCLSEQMFSVSSLYKIVYPTLKLADPRPYG